MDRRRPSSPEGVGALVDDRQHLPQLGVLMPELDDAAKKTYLYLRVSLAAAFVLLGVAILVQVINDRGHIDTTISAYYYTPVRAVFVGVLVGAAFPLLAIRGRPVEDVLLDVAGMLIPLVAFIPTPAAKSADNPCSRGDSCIPDSYLPGVDLSIIAVLALGLSLLIFAAFTLNNTDVARRRGFAVAVTIWVVVLLVFLLGRPVLYDYGHYAAAIPMFGCIVAVCFINARKSSNSGAVGLAAKVNFNKLYGVIATLMALALLAALLIWAIVIRPAPTIDNSLIFWLQATLLALFVVFWVAQTVEFADVGLPPEARES